MIAPGGEVRFEHSAPRRFDLVLGVFGDESAFSAPTGAYLGVLSLPNDLGLHREVLAGRARPHARLLLRLDHPAPRGHLVPGGVTLVGDAGYCPGPAVGGSTSLAVVAAYVLAGELARAGGDHERAFSAHERAMAEHVRGSRAAALRAARTLVPKSRLVCGHGSAALS